MNNYDCNSLALNGEGWGIKMSQAPTCSYLESDQFGKDVKASGLDPTWLALSHEKSCVAKCSKDANGMYETSCVNACPEVMKCDCSGCLCNAQTGANILHDAFTTGGTDAYVNWSPEGESISKAQIKARRPTAITTDFRSVVQEVVDLKDWRPGNAMAFVIDGEADSTGAVRSYESFDGSNSAEHEWTSAQAAYGPTLEVAYCAPVQCPAGHTFGSAMLRVDNALDDVEESQAEPGKAKTGVGFLYQGSSDLEIGNDPEVGGAQYVGIRFQNSPIPAGAHIKSAALMLTIDESYNKLEECDVDTHDPMLCRRFNEWMTATIKMRKVAHAPEWLDPESTDPQVIANRDCSRDPVAGNIDSVCYTNYDCDAISQWEPIKRYIEDNIGWDLSLIHISEPTRPY